MRLVAESERISSWNSNEFESVSGPCSFRMRLPGLALGSLSIRNGASRIAEF